ncbi:PAS domain S-box protein [Natrinema sp. 74]|uniref:PAS domain S-box protein n=1 Tax=Natrinema sp. 74 TaxID=3384159 RepID=UPI0038D45C08
MGSNTRANARIVTTGPDVGAAIERTLEERGVVTDAVQTADECLEGLSSADCVVIASAVEADPVELCEAIRAQRVAVPIVVYPDDGSEALAGAVVAAGADGYVPRSQGLETLAERVDELLVDRNGPSVTHTEPVSDATVQSAVPDESTDRFELLVEQSPLAIIEWTPEFEVRGWNPAATELFGYDAAEALGESADDLLVPESEREDLLDYWDGLVDGRPSRRVNRNVCKDGTTVTCEWFNTPLIEDGDVVSVLSFGQDISAEITRANALEALQETTRKLLRAESTDEIADIVMTATGDVIDRPLAAIRFYDDDHETLELAGVSAAVDGHTDDITSMASDDTIFWDAYTASEPTVVENVSAEQIPYDLGIGVGTAILHPLGEHGLLTVASPEGAELDDAEMHLIHGLAATAEAALDRAARERELERTKTVVETVDDCVYRLDREGRFVTVNSTMVGETGYDRDELLGEHISKVLTDESVERGSRHIRALATDDERRVATYEITLTGTNGERTPAEVNMALLYADGEIEGTVGIARDISERKRMERQLVDRKAKIEGLHSIASRLEDCESQAEIYELTVEAAEDVLGFDNCCVDRVDGDDLVREAVSSGFETDSTDRRALDDGIAGTTYRTQQPRRCDEVDSDEETVPEIGGRQSVLSVPIGDHGVFRAVSTEPAAFTAADEELAKLLLSHVTDAIDRIAFEERLRTERDRFAALFENVPDAVISARYCDDDPIVEAVNPAFERVFGYDEGAIVDEPIDDVLVPANARDEAAALDRRSQRGETVEAEVTRRTADGVREFMMRIVPMETDGSSDRSFGLYTDITAQKQRQKRLEILNRVLRHDLRNGMNIIDGCAEMLADAVDDADSEYAEIIKERTSELIDLAGKTRTVERILDRDEIATGPIDLTAAIDGAIDRLEREHDAEITSSLPDQRFARVGDYLQTAVFQLLENAVEHNDRARPTVDVTLRDCPDDEMLTLTVADDGPGIPEEERELLEGDREITQLRHASGLGLWLVNWVVTQAGGRLSFADNEPRGTVVTLEVPRADPESVGPISDGGTAAGD